MSATTVCEPKARHGRLEVRMLWALADPALNGYAGSAGTAGVPWPSLAQVCRVERHRLVLTAGGVIADESREVSYAITSRAAARADAPLLAQALRGHWGIENTAHHVRDVTFGEDACQIRTGAAPQVRAACLNLVIALLRRAGAANLAAGVRTCAGRPAFAVQLVHIAGREGMI